MPASAQLALPQGPELITNIAQISRTGLANLPSRRLVNVDLPGTIVLNGQTAGNSGGVVLLDGSPVLHLLRAGANTHTWRGQRVRISGQGVLDGTNLLLDTQPLIDNDGSHSTYERSAGRWLEAGEVPVRVRYFNLTGDKALTVSMQGPGLPREEIPAAMLSHRETNQNTRTVSWGKGLSYRCYEGAWNALPDFDLLPVVAAGTVPHFDIGVAKRGDYFGMQFDGCVTIPQTGFYVFYLESDDGSVLDIGERGILIKPEGWTNLPALAHMSAGELVGANADQFCATLDGVVTFAVRDEKGLQLEISSGRGRATIEVVSDLNVDPQWLLGVHISATGICQSVFTPEGYHVAGHLTVSSLESIHLLDLPRQFWISPAALSARLIREQLTATNLPGLVRIQGLFTTNADFGSKGISDASGEIFLAGDDSFNPAAGSHVEALGMAAMVGSRPTLLCYALRQISAPHGNGRRELPLLTTVKEVKQMSREEAELGYPVKVRGVITFIWPGAGFFLQDATWSIDVRMSTNVTMTTPHIGEYWEVSGETCDEFAPDILATDVKPLGEGMLPEPVRPNTTQLADGSMDTLYIEVQGIVLQADGNALYLLTRDGRIRVQLPEISDCALTNYAGALVRLRGCLIPGRDVNTEQVKLGDFELRNATIAVDEPAPAAPFDLPLKHATDLLLFDAHASPIQWTRIQGIVLQQRDGATFIMDRTNGVRIVTETLVNLEPGDLIEAVGFPNLNGPSPVFNDALIRQLRHGALPAALPLAPDKLLDGSYDSTRVRIHGTLVSQRDRGTDQIFEMRTGSRLWLARLSHHGGILPELALGSFLELTGVYAAQGGDRTRAREIDSFELLLNSPLDVQVLRSPPWLTARRALGVAGALLAVLLLATVWIWALHLKVEERTSALKSEIEDHKRTELQLEEKTRMLTTEIDERLRIEAEVERGHKQLLVTSRLAGMAEVATSVLHNVGNVMTSVNVLSSSIVDLVRDSKVSSVTRLGELLGSHRRELNRFLNDDERGRKMPDYVGQLGAHLTNEQSLLLQKVKVLNDNIHHINEIVAMQQDYAQVSGVLEKLRPQEVVEDALRMHGESLKRHGIKLIHDYEQISAVLMDRHKVLQIIFNLLENAKYACIQGNPPDKKISVALHSTADGFVQLMVSDNGVGISPENVTRIFGQGFSTRKDGHGIGLHSSILAAQDMGGRLTAHSDGPGRGAIFTLEIPTVPPHAAPPQRG
ncbi:MAG: ATP-binding protein [Verrucomicrobiota bacterium]